MVSVVPSGGSRMSWVHWNINYPRLKNKLNKPVNNRISGKRNKRRCIKAFSWLSLRISESDGEK